MIQTKNEARTKASQRIFNWICADGMFRNLILTTEGTLLVASEQEAAADWFWLYSDGTFSMKENDEFHCVGDHLDAALTFETIVGKTAMNPIEDVGFFLRSQESVLDADQAFLALLQYKEVLAMVVAVGTISRRIYLTLLNHTPEDEAFMKMNFVDILRRCDSNMADLLTASQRMMPVSHMMAVQLEAGQESKSMVGDTIN